MPNCYHLAMMIGILVLVLPYSNGQQKACNPHGASCKGYGDCCKGYRCMGDRNGGHKLGCYGCAARGESCTSYRPCCSNDDRCSLGSYATCEKHCITSGECGFGTFTRCCDGYHCYKDKCLPTRETVIANMGKPVSDFEQCIPTGGQCRRSSQCCNSNDNCRNYVCTNTCRCPGQENYNFYD